MSEEISLLFKVFHPKAIIAYTFLFVFYSVRITLLIFLKQ